MKRSHKNIEPSVEGTAQLILHNKLIAEVPCKVWVPRHNYERPFLKFESKNQVHKTIQIKSNKYDVRLNIFGFDNELNREIIAEEVFIDNFCVKHIGNSEPPIISFQGIPKVLYEVSAFCKHNQKNTKSTLFIYLEYNSLLSPDQIITAHYSGNIEVKEVRSHKAKIGPLEEVKFDRHYYRTESDIGFNWNSRLVAVLDINIPSKELSSSSVEIWAPIEDYLLIASFAADQWTPIMSWQVSDSSNLIRAWHGNISLDEPEKSSIHKLNDSLIDLSDFEEFIDTAFTNLNGYDADNRELLKYAIQRVLPRKNRTVQTSVLSFFSALESIVLIYRQIYDCDLLVNNKKDFKKLRTALKNTIHEYKAIFPNTKHLKYFEKNLPSLNHVPLADAFNLLVQKWNISLSDLWPVFESSSGPTLYKIRNILIHGDTFRLDQMLALSYAVENLEYVVKRLILAALGWQIEKSNISREVLIRRGWRANAALDDYMKSLSS